MPYVDVSCAGCGRNIHKRESEKKRFCSHECYVTTTKRELDARDSCGSPGCKRCGRLRGELNRHHIEPSSEGGADTPDNLITLCTSCHLEWHQIAEGMIPFYEWLSMPPLLFIYLQMQSNAALTLGQLRGLWAAWMASLQVSVDTDARLAAFIALVGEQNATGTVQ